MSEPLPKEVTAYRRGVGIMLVNGRGLVFVGERRNTPGAWQMPQGGIDAGEAPAEAALRELEEEIGTAKAEIVAESRDWLSYELPAALRSRVWGGRYAGQRQKWFLCRFTGRDSDIDLERHRHPEFERWRWIERGLLPTLAVDFKRRLYEDILAEFAEPLAQLGGE